MYVNNDFDIDSDDSFLAPVSTPHNKPKTPRRVRRVVESSDSESSDTDRAEIEHRAAPVTRPRAANSTVVKDVIDLTLSFSDAEYEPKKSNPMSTTSVKKTTNDDAEETAPLWADVYSDENEEQPLDDPWNVDDGSVLIL